MKTSELFVKFTNFEKQHNMFYLKSKCGIYWWDIVRYSVYEELNNKFIRGYTAKINVVNKKRVLHFAYQTVKDTAYLLYSWLFKKKYLFFLCSRSKNDQGLNYDSVAEPYLNTLNSKDIFYIETYFEAKTKYVSSKSKLKRILKIFINTKQYDIDFDINELLNSEFGTNIDFSTIIQENLNNYNLEYTYYKLLLKLLKPSYCFIIQNGVQKALFAASSDVGIHCVELQHGQVNSFHISYSYPNDIDYLHLNTFPKTLFTYAEFWNKTNYASVKKVNMGIGKNIHLYATSENQNDVAVIFANIYTDTLIPFVKDLSSKFENKIYIKLHPNQEYEVEYIKNMFISNKNIEVIYIEKTMEHTLSLVSSIIMIQSTTVYEALQLSKKVFLYKQQDYDMHADVFDNPNVYLIDGVDDFLENKDNIFVKKQKDIYFEEFKPKKFLSFIEENL